MLNNYLNRTGPNLGPPPVNPHLNAHGVYVGPLHNFNLELTEECLICGEHVYQRTMIPCSGVHGHQHKLMCTACVTTAIWGNDVNPNGIPHGVAQCPQCMSPIHDFGIGMGFNPAALGYFDVRTRQTEYPFNNEYAIQIFDEEDLDPGALQGFPDAPHGDDWAYNPYAGMLERLEKEGRDDPRIDAEGNDIILCKVAMSMPQLTNWSVMLLHLHSFARFGAPFQSCSERACCMRVDEPFRVESNNTPMVYYNSHRQQIGNTPVDFVAVQQFDAVPIIRATSWSWLHGRVEIWPWTVPRFLRCLDGVDMGYLRQQGYTHMRDTYIYPEVFKYQDEERAGVHARLANYNAFLQTLCDVFCPRGFQKHVIEDTLTLWMQYRAWRTYVLGHHTITRMVDDRAVPFMTQVLN